ncbi:MAG: hypothetical protein JKX74_08605 [Flavobacteriales bacterium]|nr:hypothetical protein [Flavobacteriales bacterium]
MPNLLDGEYSYTRFDLKVEKTFRIKNLGKPHVQLLGGYVSGETPYTLLYSGNGSFLSYNVSAENTFETMRLNEFLSDKYVSLFLSHNFGHLLLKAKKFKPDIVLVTNLGIGALTNPEKHQGIDINTLERGYFESGFRINNMLRYSLLGFGVGVFYRYGPYALPNWQDNLAAKFTLTVVM